ncbi:UDP-N-acetylmuramate dehydrogenase [Luteirhabdus pelagi]|uniref:UDP-N-acetylmuramate dehydrogenase n=1 Tax=Luteirhabdus pelagi TaxID=2792783 RepID=UPI00193A324B|nr:UDP-N-acetylmuramate dehydrogenase [Luteirhabdus pelagi]
MHIEQNKSLQPYNTFGIDVSAKQFVSITAVDELKTILAENNPVFILGGGSNMLLTKDLDTLVVHLNLKGISIENETEDHVYIKAMAGENWHEFVLHCLAEGYGGIENLSLIPGNIGTAPIQNIGAYGVELKDVFESCRAVEIETGKERTFTKDECHFGYRDSIFKNEAKGKYCIVSVTLQLTKKNHELHTSYGAIQDELKKRNISSPTIQDISKAVISIRQSKLPNPKEIGNSGSFFKNPVLNAEAFREFKSNYPEAPYYELSDAEYKVPAGWLIEQAGFKGKRFGDAGVHDKQALVLVNHGNASGEELWNLALQIQKKVREQFGIYIEPEVNIL